MKRKKLVNFKNQKTRRSLHHENEKDLGDFSIIVNHPNYEKLNTNQKKFVYELFLQPLTNKTKTQIYADTYGKEILPLSAIDNQGKEKRLQRDYYNSGYWMVLQSKKIQPLLQLIKNEHAKIYYINSERILKEEATIAFSNIAQYIGKDGQLTCHPNKLPTHVQKAIKSIKTITKNNGEVIFEVKLWDKSQSLSRLETMGNMNPKQEINVNTKTEVNSEYDLQLLSYEEKKQLSHLLNKCKKRSIINIDNNYSKHSELKLLSDTP